MCFTAQSLFNDYQMHAKKCTQVCPHLSVFQLANKFTRLDRRSSALFGNNVIQASKQPNSIPWGFDIPKRSVQNEKSYKISYKKISF